MKNVIFSICLLMWYTTVLQGQTSLEKIDPIVPSLQEKTRGYEVTQTGIVILDNYSYFANKNRSLVGEEVRLIELESMSKKPGLNSNILISNQHWSTSMPYLKSRIFDNDGPIQKRPMVVSFSRFNVNEMYAFNQGFGFGNSEEVAFREQLKIVTLSAPESRSITELPGYVPVATFNVPIKHRHKH